jgi:curved DNA-binding protein
MDFKDYYAVLGIAEDADEKAIKTAYRKLARQYHPDVSKEANAEEKFKEVAEAYEVLKSPEKRAEYDQLRRYGQAGQPFEAPPGWQPHGDFGGHGEPFDGDFSDFFESIFGGARRAGSQRARRGQDVEMELPLFLEETLSEQSKPIRYALPQYDAQGRPVGQQDKSLNVKIPAGIADGERIRLKGQGAPGTGGAANGDLYLQIRLVPHPLFDVEGKNLLLAVPLAPWEAALGAKVEIPTLGGRISLSIPANSQTGQRLRIKGKGLPDKQAAGDLYAILKVVMPKAGDAASRELWERLAETSRFDPRAEWSKRP